MTADLVAFLRARLDEDEHVSREASPGPWHRDGGSVHTGHPTDQVVDYSESADHIARHDPARVLAEVDAKRRIVDLHRVIGGWQDEDGNDFGDGCEECGHSMEYGDRGGWCETLRLLALPYADHPDYREDWRP